MRKLKKEIWPYQINLNLPDYNIVENIEKWCASDIGHRFGTWYSYNFYNSIRTYAFTDSETFLVFKIIWGKYEDK